MWPVNKKIRVMVVDDSVLARTMISNGLNASPQIEVVATSFNAQDARAKIDKFQPDVMTLDVEMPGMNGLETTKEIRKIVGDELPILIISAYDWSDIEDEARAAGAHGFISKPLFKSNLYLGLSKYMGGSVPEEKQEAEQLHFEGLHILLAEDNELNWEIAHEILTEVGFEVDWAEDGKICVDKFSQSEPGYYDVVLMDIRMPVMNGYEAAKALRSLDRPDANLPIIAMTADAFADDVQYCLSCGMNAHVAKPLDVEHLKKVIREYVK